MRVVTSLLALSLLLQGSMLFAEEDRAAASAERLAHPPATAAVPTARAGNAALPLRPLLSHFARYEAQQRYGEGAIGLAGSGLLIGSAIAVGPEDRTWSSVLWISGGVVALGSVASWFVPSELEALERDAGNLSDDELRARWETIARAKFLERRAGAIVGVVLGATSVTLGGLVLDGMWDRLGDDPRRVVGWGLIAGGALGMVESGVRWFVPSAVEVGFEAASASPAFELALAPTRNGVSLALTGEF